MDKICDYNHCTGCGACAGVCPKGCITLMCNKDDNNHIYPVIDHEACIDCRLCEKNCPVNKEVELNALVETYAAYVKNDDICMNSSSGGLAYSLAAEVIGRGGVVYGCIVDYGENFSIKHSRIDRLEDLSLTQGSKYVQSRIDREIYRSVKSDLDAGKEVIFFGTGCQIAGVKNFLRKDYSSFFAVDIICHGVPPQKILTDFLSLKYEVDEIKSLRFREKNSFGIYGIPIHIPLHRNLYMMGFMKGLYYRESCYSCRYATSKRCSDITLGDFWGLKEPLNPSRKSQGTSVVLINNAKGRELIERVRSKLTIAPRPLEEAVAGNPQLRRPSSRHYAYQLFRKLYPVLGFRAASRICLLREKIFYAFILPIHNKLHNR